MKQSAHIRSLFCGVNGLMTNVFLRYLPTALLLLKKGTSIAAGQRGKWPCMCARFQITFAVADTRLRVETR